MIRSPKPAAAPCRWGVYLIRNSRHMAEIKDKFAALVYIRPQPHGFVINSRPRLPECSVRIAWKELSCLRHDSSLMCNIAFPFTRNELGNKLCDLSGELIERVLETVLNCPLLEARHKERITGAE